MLWLKLTMSPSQTLFDLLDNRGPECYFVYRFNLTTFELADFIWDNVVYNRTPKSDIWNVQSNLRLTSLGTSEVGFKRLAVIFERSINPFTCGKSEIKDIFHTCRAQLIRKHWNILTCSIIFFKEPPPVAEIVICGRHGHTCPVCVCVCVCGGGESQYDIQTGYPGMGNPHAKSPCLKIPSSYWDSDQFITSHNINLVLPKYHGFGPRMVSRHERTRADIEQNHI